MNEQSALLTQIIDGKSIAREQREKLASQIAQLEYTPTLAVVLVGEDPASQIYVRNKIRLCESVGMGSVHHKLDAHVNQLDIERLIVELNEDETIDGILVQLPLPSSLDETRIINLIDADKDVDGLTRVNAGRLVSNELGLRPCTPVGCILLAKSALGDDLSGLHVVVVGRSILVGKPVAALFLNEDCTVTIAHSRTKDLKSVCQSADILVAAVGRAELINGDFLKPGAVVIDVGINRANTSAEKNSKPKILGDVDFDSCQGRASYITPVPGGVGPMTIASLLTNTVAAATLRRQRANTAISRS